MRTRRSSQDADEAEPDGQSNSQQHEEEDNASESDQNSANDDDSDNESGSGSEEDESSDDDSSSSSDEDEDDTTTNSGPSRAEVSQEEIRHAVALASEAARKTFGWDSTQKDKAGGKSKGKGRTGKFGGPGEGNALSDLIPGYTAPMRLEVTYAKPAGAGNGKDGAASVEQSLQEMRRRAQRTDRSTASHVISSGAQSFRADAMRHRRPGSSGATSFKMGTKRGPDGTAGRGWFGMTPAALTDDVKADIAILRNRTYLDPKRFYKKADIMDPKMVQVGTVIEGSEEYYSSRLTKKQRRQNLAEEIMADVDVKKYAKKQFTKIQDSRQKRFGQGYGRKKQRTGRKGRR